MSDSNLVRVRVGGQETNVSRSWAERRNLEILDDEPTHRGDGSIRRPTRKGGRPMKPRVNLSPAVTPPAAEVDETPVPYAEQTAGELQALVEARNDVRGDDEPQVTVEDPADHEQLVRALEYDDEFLALLRTDGQ